MMNRITVSCVAVFLICMFSVGHVNGGFPGRPSNLIPKKFNRRYYNLVVPKIEIKMNCPDMSFTYLQGTSQIVAGTRLKFTASVQCPGSPRPSTCGFDVLVKEWKNSVNILKPIWCTY